MNERKGLQSDEQEREKLTASCRKKVLLKKNISPIKWTQVFTEGADIDAVTFLNVLSMRMENGKQTAEWNF